MKRWKDLTPDEKADRVIEDAQENEENARSLHAEAEAEETEARNMRTHAKRLRAGETTLNYLDMNA